MKHSSLQNQFKYEPVSCRNTSKMWMHDIARIDTKNKSNMLLSFGIFLAFIAMVITLFYLMTLYPAAYPNKPIVKTINR